LSADNAEKTWHSDAQPLLNVGGLAVQTRPGKHPKKTAQGRVGVPAQIKEATQQPAQHRSLQLQASEEERLEKNLLTCAGLAAERPAYGG
jgi:hypothetical protein